MATTSPASWRRRISAILSSGYTSASTRSIPTSAATRSAVARASPVRSTGVSPSSARSATAPALVGFRVSTTESVARGTPSHETVTAPSRRPTSTEWPSTDPTTPTPGTFRKSATSGSSPTSRRAPSATALAIGCSEAASTAPASRSTSPRVSPSSGVTSVSAIRPSVRVPVLSSTTVVMRCVRSRTSGPLMRIPSCAPRPVPTSNAVGVARPRAHGHAMISTATAAENASAALPVATSQPASVASESPSTTGTKTPETRSTSRWIGALPDCASATSVAIWASAVSSPTLVARTIRRPYVLTVAPATASPGPTSSGTGSPVSIERSIADAPSTTTPSVATFSPGRTTNRSPAITSAIGTENSTPSRKTCASLAPSSRRPRIAALDRRRARASR